jgi:hypothetical protein
VVGLTLRCQRPASIIRKYGGKRLASVIRYIETDQTGRLPILDGAWSQSKCSALQNVRARSAAQLYFDIATLRRRQPRVCRSLLVDDREGCVEFILEAGRVLIADSDVVAATASLTGIRAAAVVCRNINVGERKACRHALGLRCIQKCTAHAMPLFE